MSKFVHSASFENDAKITFFTQSLFSKQSLRSSRRPMQASLGLVSSTVSSKPYFGMAVTIV